MPVCVQKHELMPPNLSYFEVWGIIEENQEGKKGGDSMYCIRCGSQLKDGTQYCIFCGAPTAAVKKERPRPIEDDTVSIPVDFFSSRMAQDGEDDFTIAIPDDFVRTDTIPQAEKPDDIGDMDFTRMVTKEDIREAIEEQMRGSMELPDEAGDDDFTRMVAKEHIREAMQEQAKPDGAADMETTRTVEKQDIRAAMQEQAKHDSAADMETTRTVEKQDIRAAMQEQAKHDGAADMETTRTVEKQDIRAAMQEQAKPDSAGALDYTRAVAKEEIRAAMQEQQEEELPQVDVADIPDIPIPSDFIADAPESFTEAERQAADEDEDDAPEQLMSKRGMLFVILVVVLLFAIAVGACVTVLRGDTAPAEDTGSGSAEVGFWSPADGE